MTARHPLLTVGSQMPAGHRSMAPPGPGNKDFPTSAVYPAASRHGAHEPA